MIKRSLQYVTLALMLTACVTKNDKAASPAVADDDLTQYVDPFIGTGGHGHTYPGVSMPFGMLQVSPNNGNNGWDWVSGYHYPDTLITGFTHLSLTGTGIGDLSDLLIMPYGEKVELKSNYRSREDRPYTSAFSHNNETATAGYYQVYLEDSKINAELTATERTAFHKYTFGESQKKTVVVDLGFAINWDRPQETQLTLEDENTLTGYRFSSGWANNQKVFFVARFSEPVTQISLIKDEVLVDAKTATGKQVAGQLFFDNATTDTLEVSVSISSVSVDNAKENMDKMSFAEAKSAAKDTWNKALNTLHVETSIDSIRTKFYTSAYHAKLAPTIFSDKNGEFRLSNDSIVKGDFTAFTTMSLWDTFRAQQPLLTLTHPERVGDIVSSMLAYYDERGVLPVWNLYGNETNTMTGYHSIPIIAEAYLKGIKGFDINRVYEAMKTTMIGDARGLKEYKEYSYVPFDAYNESVTVNLELAYDDWCVAQIAKALDKQEDYEYFLDRSMSYKKLYDKETGFMRGKSKDGKSWHEPFDPRFSRHREGTDYTEGNAWQHSWFVPQDPQGLIDLHGGGDAFATQLEELFTQSSEITGDDVSPDISGLIGQYAHGNEPSHHIAYFFNKAGKPWLTQYWVKQILDTQYTTKPDGLSGNEDCGQMSAWYTFSSMGIYPFNPASTTYEIGTPLFEKAAINLPDGKTFTIVAEGVSNTNFYIQSATLNGQEFNTTTLTHEQILAGGTLKFIMGPEPNKNWGLISTNE